MATPIVPQCGIYVITCLANDKIYIGSAVNIKRRWQWHKHALKRGEHHSKHLQRAYAKYGKVSFTFSVLELCTPEQRIEREQYWIDELKPYVRSIGFNLANSAKGGAGHNLTASHRANISTSLKGTVRSPETRAKIGNAHRGRKHSEQSKANMSIAHKGKTQSAEYVEKRIAPLRGRKLPSELVERRADHHRKPYVLTTPDGQELQVFGLYRFCRENGLQGALMSKVARGERKHHKGWKCRHAE